jgi:hypothetical protein
MLVTSEAVEVEVEVVRFLGSMRGGMSCIYVAAAPPGVRYGEANTLDERELDGPAGCE